MPTDHDFKKNQFKTTIKPTQITSNESNEDFIIILIIIWMLASKLFYTLAANYYSEAWFMPLNTLISIIWAIVPLLLAFTLKDKSKQPIFFSLGGIYFVYRLYEVIMPFVNG